MFSISLNNTNFVVANLIWFNTCLRVSESGLWPDIMTILTAEFAINCGFFAYDACDTVTSFMHSTVVEFHLDDEDWAVQHVSAKGAHFNCLCMILVYCAITMLRG